MKVICKIYKTILILSKCCVVYTSSLFDVICVFFLFNVANNVDGSFFSIIFYSFPNLRLFTRSALLFKKQIQHSPACAFLWFCGLVLKILFFLFLKRTRGLSSSIARISHKIHKMNKEQAYNFICTSVLEHRPL